MCKYFPDGEIQTTSTTVIHRTQEWKNTWIIFASKWDDRCLEAQAVSKKAKVKRKQTDKTVNRQNDICHFFKKQGIITTLKLSRKDHQS